MSRIYTTRAERFTGAIERVRKWLWEQNRVKEAHQLEQLNKLDDHTKTVLYTRIVETR